MKPNLVQYIFSYLIAIVVSSCTTKSTGINQKDIEAIHNLDKSYVELCEKKDWEKLSLLLTSDVIIFPPNDSAVVGQSANLMRFKNFGNVSIEYSHRSTDVNGDGDIAYLQGNYQIKISFPNNAQPLSDRGKYLWVLQKQSDNGWKIHRIMWNSSESLSKAK